MSLLGNSKVIARKNKGKGADIMEEMKKLEGAVWNESPLEESKTEGLW